MELVWPWLFFFKDFLKFIYHNGERVRQTEKQAPCREPDMGLDPGTPGSRPGLKAGAKLQSHPVIPEMYLLIGTSPPTKLEYC